MWWGFSQKDTPKNSPSRLDRDVEYEKFKHLEPYIDYLILVTNSFIVYIDKELDVDWSLRDDSDESNEEQDKAFATILNRVAKLETTPCQELPRHMKLHFKRLLGEGIARGLQNDFNGADSVLDAATAYIEARSKETSRLWYLLGSLQTTSVFILAGVCIWYMRTPLQHELGVFAFWEVISACAGAAGALLSVICRTGKQNFDCSAGKQLHHLEASSRILAGAISGCFVGLAIHARIFLTALINDNNMASIMILTAMASGMSERLVSSIIADLGAQKIDNSPAL